MLRWTCAVRDYRAGVDPNTIREKLGLSEISWYETFAKIKRLADEQCKAPSAEVKRESVETQHAALDFSLFYS